jgi:hypothetical protein
VADTCKPSYSGSRDQENLSSKPAQAISFTRPYLKKTFPKEKGLKVQALSSSLSTTKKKKEEEKRWGLVADG